MELVKTGFAGTLESGDISVQVESRSEGGIEIDLQSTVSNQFGRQIRGVIAATLGECGVYNAFVSAVDKGALDCTIRARVTAAVYRGAGQEYPF